MPCDIIRHKSKKWLDMRSRKAGFMEKTGQIFIISGPSGVGKDTIANAIKEMRGYKSLNIKEPKSYTTRRRRKSDPEDTPYIFISEKRFSELMLDEMIEHSETHGHLYGMSRSSFEECIESGGNIVKIMDKKGALAFKQMYPDICTVIYLTPPSIEVLRKRLSGRGSETYAEYNRRMMDSIEELKDIGDFDYVVQSNSVEITSRIVFEIIYSNVKYSEK